MRLPTFHTLDVRVERRIARVTITNNPINLMMRPSLMAAFLARGGQTESGQRRLGELVGELAGSD
jgi:hypothetical protein